MPRLYDLAWTKPPALVERFLRVTVDERMSSAGNVVKPLSIEEGERVVRKLIEERVSQLRLLNQFMQIPSTSFC